MEHFKLVFNGDGAVGKTCLLIREAHGSFPTDYVPTVFDNATTQIKVGKHIVGCGLWDCAGKEDYARLRPLSYVGTDCFCVSMSVVCRSSMENLKSVWFPEIHHHQPGVPILVIGTKTDLRNDPATLEKLRQRDEQPISEEEARAFCESLGAQYIECSALTGDTHHVFLKATHMAVQFSLKQLGLLQTERFSFFERFFGKKKVPKAAQTAVVGRMDPNGNMRARNGAELLEMEQWLAATLAAGAAADSLSSCSSDE